MQTVLQPSIPAMPLALRQSWAKAKNKGELEPKQLMAMSEALQLARLHLQALAESYNSCAISADDFNNSRATFAKMGVHRPPKARLDKKLFGFTGPKMTTRASQLVDQYLMLAQNSGSAK